MRGLGLFERGLCHELFHPLNGPFNDTDLPVSICGDVVCFHAQGLEVLIQLLGSASSVWVCPEKLRNAKAWFP